MWDLAISVPDRSIPREILKDFLKYEREAYVHLRVGRYKNAEDLFRNQLDLIRDWQVNKDKPIHKGTPLHLIGLCLLLQKNIDESMRFFLMAYIEDTLSVGFKLESEADLSPASIMLRKTFQIEIEFLMKIKDYIVGLKNEGAWEKAIEPEVILDAVLNDVQPKSLSALRMFEPQIIPKSSIDHLPGTWDKRVFIGGDYDHLPILRDIQEAVIRSDFQPIIPFDFIVPEEHIHHHDLMLLHNCRLGIFEVSTPAGQLMEIERAKDYGVKVILFYTDRNGPPHSLTMMVQTAGYKMNTYRDSSDLKQKVTDWLAKF